MVTGRLQGYDRESKSVTFRVVAKPAHGQFRLLNPRTGEFTFSHDGTNSSEATVKFVAFDGVLTSEPAEVTFLTVSR
jgi:hypothetical protein